MECPTSTMVLVSGQGGGVFSHLVDEVAFVDRIEVSLWGTRRKRILPPVQTSPSIAIGGIKRRYARSIHGVCRATGNPFEFRYGRLKPWPSLPALRLILLSEKVPLTGAQVALVAGSLLRQGFRAHVGRLELTFDVSKFPVTYFRRHVFTRARRIRKLRDDSGRETLYVGGPRSPWQLCVYQKSESIVRVEFKLRRQLLRARAIEQPHSLVLLRTLDLWELVWFRDFSEDRMRSALGGVPELTQESPRRWPLRTLASFLGWRLGLDPAGLLRISQAEQVLRRMQENLIW